MDRRTSIKNDSYFKQTKNYVKHTIKKNKYRRPYESKNKTSIKLK